MKIVSLAMVLFLGMITLSFGQVDFRIFGEMTGDYKGSPVLENNSLSGLGWEVIINKTGIGSRALAKFTQDSTTGDWKLDFQGNLGLSYHLFGAGSRIDFFGEAGLGCSGGVDLSNGVSKGDINLQGIALSLFPYLGFGGSLSLDNILVGARLNYHEVNWAVPGAPIDPYPLSGVQFGIYVGFTTGKIEIAPPRNRNTRSQGNQPEACAPVEEKQPPQSPSVNQDRKTAEELVQEEMEDWDDDWID